MHFLEKRMAEELQGLKEQALLRKLTVPCGHDFSSNDYFALSQHEQIKAVVKESVDSHGYGSTSSRFIRGERALYQALEERLASWCNAPSALLFSCGYMANIGVLTSLIKKEDIVFSDSLNHASIIDGLRLTNAKVIIFPHRDLGWLSNALKETPVAGAKFIVTESLFSMDGDIAPLNDYADLARKYDAPLIVDEAHAVGIYGPGGTGLIDHFGIRNEVLCAINGLGKAFGCYGAFIAGPTMAIELIKQRARTLMYSTALPPLALCAIDEALSLIIAGDHLRKALFANMTHLQSLHNFKGPLAAPIVPVILNDSERALKVAARLNELGFDVRAIRWPTVAKDSARLRITTKVSHTSALIDEFLSHLRACL